MPSRDALIEAARNRMPPIAMATLAAIVTLMPLALAIAIIAGLILQFPFVLLALPVLIGLTLPRSAKQAS